jgi:hypothetical protein
MSIIFIYLSTTHLSTNHFFGQYQGLDSGPHAYRKALYHLNHVPSPFVLVILLRAAWTAIMLVTPSLYLG